MDAVCKFGPMDPGTMASGEMELLMGMEDWSMLKVMYTKESGLRTKPMDLECIPISTVQDTKANGFKTSNTATVLSSGQMVPSLKVNMNKEWSTGKENSSGVIKVYMMVTSTKTTFMVKASTYGQMEECMLGNG